MRLLALAAVLAIAVSVWSAAEVQRSSAERAFADATTADAMLIAMIDQETGLRGYLQTGRDSFLTPYQHGRGAFEAALAQSRETADGRRQLVEIDRQEQLARRWQASAEGSIAARRAGLATATRRVTLSRKQLMDAFRAANRDLKVSQAEERAIGQRIAQLAAVGIALLLSGVFCAVGYVTVVRPWRQVTERDRRQRQFADGIQLTGTEPEAYDMLRRQLEQRLPDARVVVLNRNNSADRLLAETSTAGLAIADELAHAHPRTCLAIRGGRPHTRDSAVPAVLECGLCGRHAGASSCVPSLVGGEVIGAVLALHPRPLSATDLDEMVTTVSQAAPNVANLRNLAIAERQAMTDGLTGLPNARAVQDTLKRMAAQASRAVEPLTAIMLDLDHFKSINDTYGHQQGDDVLAAVGALLAQDVRASDFAGRYGGEEFLLLLPHTDGDGGVELAEKLRRRIADLRPQGLGRQLSASFGVASLPHDAGDWTGLVRCADRALYAAKAGGRDRVTRFELAADEQPPPAPGAAAGGAAERR